MAERLVGRPAPDFTMETATGDGKDFGTVSLSDYRGKWLVFFFYPLDFTFVCPTEITALSDAAEVFKGLNTEVLGVSVDSKHSHRAWINTPKNDNGLEQLNFPLASDINETSRSRLWRIDRRRRSRIARFVHHRSRRRIEISSG